MMCMIITNRYIMGHKYLMSVLVHIMAVIVNTWKWYVATRYMFTGYTIVQIRVGWWRSKLITISWNFNHAETDEKNVKCYCNLIPSTICSLKIVLMLVYRLWLWPTINPFTTIHDRNFRRHSSSYVTIHDGNFRRIYYSYTRIPGYWHALEATLGQRVVFDV